MEKNKKIDFKGITKNAVEFSKQKYGDVKKFTNDVAVPKIKETALTTKENISQTVSKVSDKVKTTITEEQIQEILDTLYIKSVDGIPKVSLPINDLVEDYLSKNDTVEKAAKSLINNSTVKCGTSGFLTSFGGFATIIATLPANITSVMYVQLRMCCAIAKMGGYDIHSDQVQTLIYACLTGAAAKEILKSSGVKFVNKLGVKMIERIPFKTIKAINQKVGFRFITKFGETGIVNLGKVVPVVGGFVGGGIDVASTRVIGKNAYNLFIKGKLPTGEETEDKVVLEATYEELDDLDTKTLNEALNDNKNN